MRMNTCTDILLIPCYSASQGGAATVLQSAIMVLLRLRITWSYLGLG